MDILQHFLMLLTEIVPQAVLKQKKSVKLFAMWSETGIKNTILLNGIYLVLSTLFIQLRSSQDDWRITANKVTA